MQSRGRTAKLGLVLPERSSRVRESEPPIRREAAHRATLVGSILVGMLAGCAASRPSIEFVGSPARANRSDQPLPRLAALPQGAVRLGAVYADCQVQHPRIAFAAMPLSSLDCSVRLLTRAIEERAKQGGATALVGSTCYQRMPSGGESTAGPRLDCEATAARLAPSSDASPTSSTMQSKLAPTLSADILWATEVDFTPAPRASEPAASAPSAIEVPRLPLADVPLGELTVRVTPPAKRHDALLAIQVAAARLGASHFESPHCFRPQGSAGWQCHSLLSRSENDERLVQMAR